MEFSIDRRAALKAGAALVAAQALPAWSQDKPKVRMTAVFSDKDIRADMYRMIAQDLAGDFAIEGRVLTMLPLRNRRDGKVTRISEGLTEWRCGDHVGYGWSEYLDQIA